MDDMDLQLREPEFNILIPYRVRIYIPITFLLTVTSLIIFLLMTLLFELFVCVTQNITNFVCFCTNFHKYLGNFDKMKLSFSICMVFCILTLECSSKWLYLCLFISLFLSTLKLTNRTSQGK